MRATDLAKELEVPYKEVALNFKYVTAPVKVLSDTQMQDIRLFFSRVKEAKTESVSEAENIKLPTTIPIERMQESIRIRGPKSPYWKYRAKL